MPSRRFSRSALRTIPNAGPTLLNYLLGGLVVCGACGHHHLGTAAHGKTHRYRYYICYSRQRYGPDTCAAERVDAGRLDQGVPEPLLRTYEDQQLLDEAVEEYLVRSRAARPRRQDEAAAVESEIRRSEEALDRYFHAFESGKMPEDLCGHRIEDLGEKLRALRARHAELTAAIDEDQLTGPSPAELEAFRAEIRQAIEAGLVARRKAVLQELVAEVRIESRRVIRPTFRPPLRRVRDLSRLVGWEGVEPASFRGGFTCHEGASRTIGCKWGPSLTQPGPLWSSPAQPVAREAPMDRTSTNNRRPVRSLTPSRAAKASPVTLCPLASSSATHLAASSRAGRRGCRFRTGRSSRRLL